MRRQLGLAVPGKEAFPVAAGAHGPLAGGEIGKVPGHFPGDEIPFVQDGLRDGEHIRHQMHRWFLAHIKKSGVPHIIVSGDQATRLQSAVTAVREMIAAKRHIT